MSLSAALDEIPGLTPLFSLIAAVLAAGVALQLRYGFYSPMALAWLTISLAYSATAAVVRWPRPTIGGEILLRYALLAAIAVELAILLFAWPPAGDLANAGRGTRTTFYALAICAAGMVAFGAADVKWMRRTWFLALIAISFALCVLVIRTAPPPQIDVWFIQQEAARALLHGRNPYAMTFANPYGIASPYGKGLATPTELLFGFPYPPISLVLSALGYAIAGDHRYSQAAAICLAAALMGGARGGRNAKLAASLLLLAPRLLHVIDQAWTEPLVVLLFAATVFLACRESRWLPVALGLFLASKQYLFILTPLTFMLLPQPWRWRDLGKLLLLALAAASVVTLPFGLFHWPAFVKALVTVHRLAPPRPDALGLPNLWIRRDETAPSSLLPIVAAGIALSLSVLRAPRSPSGFSAASALVLFAFFALSRQGAPNYYFLVIAAFCMALAAYESSDSPPMRGEGPSPQPQ